MAAVNRDSQRGGARRVPRGGGYGYGGPVFYRTRGGGPGPRGGMRGGGYPGGGAGGRGGNGNGPAPHGGQPREPEEVELATKMLQIQSKRFYLDVKENPRGRFIKIAEVAAGGHKNRIVMSMTVAAEFRDKLTEFAEVYASLGPTTNSTGGEKEAGGKVANDTAAAPAAAKPATNDAAAASPREQSDILKSATIMSRGRRRYYVDLKENSRGRFLRVTQTTLNGPRFAVVVPAQGIVECRDMLTKLLEEFPPKDTDREGGEESLPEGKQFRVDNKVFYFDVGQNDRGVFMRVSEVRTTIRTAITIPQRSWHRFRDIFVEVCDKMEKLMAAAGESGGDQAAIAQTINESLSSAMAAASINGSGDDATALAVKKE